MSEKSRRTLVSETSPSQGGLRRLTDDLKRRVNGSAKLIASIFVACERVSTGELRRETSAEGDKTHLSRL